MLFFNNSRSFNCEHIRKPFESSIQVLSLSFPVSFWKRFPLFDGGTAQENVSLIFPAQTLIFMPFLWFTKKKV